MYNFNQIAKNFPFKRTIVEMNVLEVIPYDTIKTENAMKVSNHVRALIQNKIDSRKEQ